jgi:hypothetical protein
MLRSILPIEKLRPSTLQVCVRRGSFMVSGVANLLCSKVLVLLKVVSSNTVQV